MITTQQFETHLKEVGLGDNYESVLNSIACLFWHEEDYFRSLNNIPYAELQEERARHIYDVLNKEHYYDDIREGVRACDLL